MLGATHNLIPMIAQLPIVAQGDGEGDSILPLIVWAIIGFFWVLAQISQKKKSSSISRSKALMITTNNSVRCMTEPSSVRKTLKRS